MPLAAELAARAAKLDVNSSQHTVSGSNTMPGFLAPEIVPRSSQVQDPSGLPGPSQQINRSHGLQPAPSSRPSCRKAPGSLSSERASPGSRARGRQSWCRKSPPGVSSNTHVAHTPREAVTFLSQFVLFSSHHGRFGFKH